MADLRIRERREAAGLTRLELARRSGVSLTFLQTVEGGVVPRRSRAIGRVLAALDGRWLDAKEPAEAGSRTTDKQAS